MKLFTTLFVGIILAAGPAVLSSQAQTAAGQAPAEPTGKAAKHSKNKVKHKTKKSHKSKEKAAS